MVKHLRKYLLLFALVLLATVFTSCGGSLKLEKLSIDYSTIKTTYIVDEKLDFSGFKATAIYTDESLNRELTYEDVEFKYSANITATPGEKEVIISFVDSHLNTVHQFPLKIKVLAEFALDPNDKQMVIGFNRPSSLVSFSANNKAAGTSQYGSPSFPSEFAVGDQPYFIGNENEFRFLPEFTIFNKNKGEIRKLNAFYSIVDISLILGGSSYKLDKASTGDNLVTYYYKGTDYVTVDIYRGLYYFTQSAENQNFKIKVQADDNYYDVVKQKEVTLDAKVIKAYNVYEAWQLSVVDNDDDDEWAEIKKQNGIYGLDVSGIVFHNDIKVTYKDIPESFFLTTTSEVVYTNALTDEKIIVPTGTKYLKESSHLYYRKSDTPFIIQGNFFTLDFSGFPLVPSPAVFGPDAELDYDIDYSAATVFKFETTDSFEDPRPSQVSVTTIKNLSIIGNASRDNIIDAGGDLVSGGGLIFCEFHCHAEGIVDNVIGNSYFYSYKVDGGADITASNIKCYDSYLNAAIVARDSTMTVSDSYFSGSGGPSIITISFASEGRYPTITLKNTIAETALTGQELWFGTMGINAYMPVVFELSDKLQALGLGSFKNSKSQLNVKGVLCSDGANADEIIKGIDAQGKLFFDRDGIDRSSSNSHWSKIYIITKPAIQQVGMAPLFLTVNDSKGTPTTIWYDGNNFYDLNLKQYTGDTSSAIHKAFNNAKSLTLTMGGISIVIELFH